MKLNEIRISSYLYEKFTNYDNKYQKLAEREIDFSKDKDIHDTIEFLIGWKCRQFKKEKDPKLVSDLMFWYVNNKYLIPGMDENIIDADDSKLASFEALFNQLMNTRASTKKSIIHNIGHVGAAKALLILRKNMFAPWDNRIQKLLGFKPNGIGYCNYLKWIKNELVELKNDCKNENVDIYDLPTYLERPYTSLPKLIDEYCWVSITRKCSPRRIMQLNIGRKKSLT